MTSVDAELGDLATIASELENDVREILLRPKEYKKLMKRSQKAQRELEKSENKAEEVTEKANRKAAREERKRRKADVKNRAKRIHKEKVDKEKRNTSDPDRQNPSSVVDVVEEADDGSIGEKATETRRRRYSVLRILAKTRRNFRLFDDA
jgi:hypothetical protein